MTARERHVLKIDHSHIGLGGTCGSPLVDQQYGAVLNLNAVFETKNGKECIQLFDKNAKHVAPEKGLAVDRLRYKLH